MRGFASELLSATATDPTDSRACDKFEKVFLGLREATADLEASMSMRCSIKMKRMIPLGFVFVMVRGCNGKGRSSTHTFKGTHEIQKKELRQGKERIQDLTVIFQEMMVPHLQT